MGSLRKSKTVDIKGIFNWLYSLLGIWWVTIGLTLVVVCIIGLVDLLLVAIPFVVSIIIWTRRNEDGTQRVKDIFNSAILRIKEWWDRRPSFTK